MFFVDLLLLLLIGFFGAMILALGWMAGVNISYRLNSKKAKGD